MRDDSSGEPKSNPDLGTPEYIGPYRLDRRLGTGGMGEVYLAFDQRLDRRVAIKHIRTDIERDPTHRSRLQREARAVAQLSHPSIVHIFDFVESDDGDWVVMELIDGPSVTDLLRRGPLAVSQVLTIARQVAEGLAEAHDKGILHRDLKSENVMLTQGEQAKILDFGLAKVEVMKPGDSTLTRAGEVMGTCRSMSPEQAKGSSLDGRSDLFALGVLMYEMLTTVSPFQGANPVSTLTRVCTMRHRPVSQRNPKVPQIVSEVVDHLLEKDRERRPNNALAAAQTLQAVSRQLGFESAEISWPAVDTGWRPSEQALEATDTIVTWPRPGSPPVSQPRRRKGWILVLTTLVAVLLLGLWLQQRTAYAPAAESRQSVAVLGMANLTASADSQWLPTGFSELLHNQLSGDQLRIVPMDFIARTQRELPAIDGNSLTDEALTRAATLYSADFSLVGAIEKTTTDELQWTVYLQSTRSQPTHSQEIHLQTAGNPAAAATARISLVATPRDLSKAAQYMAEQIRSQLGLPAAEPMLDDQRRAALPRDLAAIRHYANGIDSVRDQQFRAARREFERAIAAEPECALPWSALARVMSALGNDLQALSASSRAVELAQTLPSTIRDPIVALDHELANRPGDAIKTYRDLYSAFPDQLDYGLSLVSASTRFGQPEAGLELSQTLRRRAAGDVRIDLLEAEAALALNRDERALAASQRVLETASLRGQKWLLARGFLVQAKALRNLQQIAQAAAAAARARSLFAELADSIEEEHALQLLRQLDAESPAPGKPDKPDKH